MRVWKEISDELVILTIVGVLAIIVAFFISGRANAEITGTIGCQSGELTIINSDRESAWSVFPADYSTSFAVSDDGRTVYFASPKAGKVTFFAASVIDGKPELESHTLYNGVEIPDDEPTPTPTPKPEPPKNPLDKAIESAKNYPAKDVEVITETFESVLSGIDRGTITTPVAARETFRALYASKAIAVDPEMTMRTFQLIAELSNAIDNTTLETVKDDYAKIVEGLKKIEVKAPAKKAEKKAETKATTKASGGCPDGQCPTGNCPLQNNGYQYRWGW